MMKLDGLKDDVFAMALALFFSNQILKYQRLGFQPLGLTTLCPPYLYTPSLPPTPIHPPSVIYR